MPETVIRKNKRMVCSLVLREDGKEICEELKKMRKMLADANGISYKLTVCNATGVCAGTCIQCDKELRALQDELLKIPE